MNDEHNNNNQTDPTAGRSTRKRSVALSVVALVAGAGVAGAVVARAGTESERPGIDVRALQAEASVDLHDVSLGELADDLAALGLEVRVVPTDPDAPTSTEPVETGSDSSSSDTTAEVDPFAGLTDDEIDALSDDEFFDRIEEAGLDIGEFLDDLYGPEDLSDAADGEYEDGEYGDGEYDDEAPPLLSAPVAGDSIDLGDADGELADAAQEIWDRFVALVPADQRQMVVGFELMPGDGEGAYVYPTDADPTKWVLGVSRGLGSDLDDVLVHEFGHLLTLQAKDVPPSGDESGCETYFTGEGCALSGSTFAEFVARFWPQSQIDELTRLNETGDWDALDAYYAANESAFVTDYAMTNPGEDLAETFAVFVLQGRPTGDTVADQKVLMLWDDPAMVALRDQIRASR